MKPQNRNKKTKFRRQLWTARQTASFVALLTGAVLFIVAVFFSIYQSSQRNLENLWSTNTAQMAHDMEIYLTRPMDAVTFGSRHVEEMLRSGESTQAIGKYLVNETEIVSALVDSNTTGIYGFVAGEYLNGSGWTPPAGYEPTQRPWYRAALEAKGEVALVRPFLNLQAGDMTMSVSCLLEDGESVISMDILLDGAQRLMDRMEATEQVDAAMVLDRTGSVVIHSDEAAIGQDFLHQGSYYQRNLAKLVLTGQGGVYHLTGPEGRQMLFTQQINEDWYSVVVVRSDKLFGSLRYLFVYSALAEILVVLVLTLLFLRVTRKSREAEQLDREVRAAAETFAALYLIDRKAERIRALRPDPKIEELMGGKSCLCRECMEELAQGLAAPQSRQALSEFMALEDLDERMGSLRFISQEFLDSGEHWMRLRYVPVERDERGRLCQILLALESIDEERRRQEHLRRLAETDLLTKIRNRSSGEEQIRERLEQGVGGMFLLMDVDRFKSVNDELGHNAGDQVIVAVARCVRATFRGTDVVFRLGGDEFAAFAPNLLEEAAAQRLIERLFRRVEEIHLPALRGRTITVSVGLTFTAPGSGDDFESIYRRSDEAMYRSKQSSGNHATVV